MQVYGVTENEGIAAGILRPYLGFSAILPEELMKKKQRDALCIAPSLKEKIPMV